MEWYLILRSCCMNVIQGVRIPYAGYMGSRNATGGYSLDASTCTCTARGCAWNTMLLQRITHQKASRCPDMHLIRSSDVPSRHKASRSLLRLSSPALALSAVIPGSNLICVRPYRSRSRDAIGVGERRLGKPISVGHRSKNITARGKSYIQRLNL